MGGVPLCNNEFEFVTVHVADYEDADDPPGQRERVTDSLIRCPPRPGSAEHKPRP